MQSGAEAYLWDGRDHVPKVLVEGGEVSGTDSQVVAIAILKQEQSWPLSIWLHAILETGGIATGTGQHSSQGVISLHCPTLRVHRLHDTAGEAYNRWLTSVA